VHRAPEYEVRLLIIDPFVLAVASSFDALRYLASDDGAIIFSKAVSQRYPNIKIALTEKYQRFRSLTTTMTVYAVLLHHTPEGPSEHWSPPIIYERPIIFE
jgi:hypothetical protein